MRSRSVLLLVLAALHILAQGSAEDHYIEDVFKTRISEVPSLGWYDSSRGFLATVNAPQVTIYGPRGMARTGRKKGELSASDLKAVQQLGLACELTPQNKVISYTIAPGINTDRALYTTKALPGTSSSGLVSIALDAARMAAVNRALGWPTNRALRRDEAVAARTGSFFYSHHRLYSSQTSLLQEEAIMLHAKEGQIIAFDIQRRLDTEPFCVDCENPKYADENVSLYGPLNVFEFSAFPYPLLFLDSGTVEGRARSLITFTPNGKLSQYRVYEYVVNCG